MVASLGGLLVVDQHRLGFAAVELVIGERELGGAGLQLGEDNNQRFLRGIGPAGIRAGQIGEPLGLLLALGRLAAQPQQLANGDSDNDINAPLPRLKSFESNRFSPLKTDTLSVLTEFEGIL